MATVLVLMEKLDQLQEHISSKQKTLICVHHYVGTRMEKRAVNTMWSSKVVLITLRPLVQNLLAGILAGAALLIKEEKRKQRIPVPDFTLLQILILFLSFQPA